MASTDTQAENSNESEAQDTKEEAADTAVTTKKSKKTKKKSGEAEEETEAEKNTDTEKSETEEAVTAEKTVESDKKDTTDKKKNDTEDAGKAEESEQTSADEKEEETAAETAADQTEDMKKAAEDEKSEAAEEIAEAEESGDTEETAEAEESEDTVNTEDAAEEQDTEKAEEAEGSGKSEKTAEAEQTEDAQQSEDDQKTDDSEKSADADQTEDTEDPVEADQPEDAGKTAETDQSEAAEKSQDTERSAEADQPEAAQESADADQPEDADESDDAGQTADAGQTTDADTEKAEESGNTADADAEKAEESGNTADSDDRSTDSSDKTDETDAEEDFDDLSGADIRIVIDSDDTGDSGDSDSTAITTWTDDTDTDDYSDYSWTWSYDSSYVFPSLPYEFRFTWDKEAARALILQGTCIYESQSEDARIVGKSLNGSLVYILADEDSDWVYIESGKVRGFVRKEDLIVDDLLDFVLDQGEDSDLADAYCLISPMYNEALTYTMTTATNPVIDGVAAVATGELDIFDSQTLDLANDEIVGELSEGNVAYILENVSDTVAYVESGDVRGFVDTTTLTIGEEADAIAAEADESAEAEELVDPEENAAIHYTITSTQEASTENTLRAEIVAFAEQFLGGRYVWGGTTLGVGVDCSGFMQQIYKHFGYSLPRTSREQSCVGTRISISEAQPGDLIFYTYGGVVHHVSMYIGDGQVIHAKGRKYGICITGISSAAAWAVRIING